MRRVRAAQRAGHGGRGSRLVRAAVCLAAFVVALPAGSSARGQETVIVRFMPAGAGAIDASAATGGAVVTCESDEPNVRGGNACELEVERGTAVRLVARATEAASPFLHWDRFECAGTGPCTVTAGEDDDPVLATFRRQELVIVVDRADGATGTVTASVPGISCGGDCTEDVPAGTEVVLTATGAHTWGRGCEPAGGDPGAASCTLTMSSTRTFARIGFGVEPQPTLPFDVRVNVRVVKAGAGSGTVTGSGTDGVGEDRKEWRIECGSGPGCRVRDLHIQTRLTLRATETDGSRFVRWLGVCSTETVCTFAAGTQKVVGAQFEPAAQQPPPPPPPPPPAPPPPAGAFAAKVTKLSVVRGAVVVRVVLDRPARATLALVRGRATLVTRRFAVAAGRSDVRFALPPRLRPGWYRLRGAFVDAGGERARFDRPFRLRR